MSYAIFFDKGNKTYRLPVNPEELNVTNAQGNETFDELALGQIVVPTTVELRKVTFEAEIPAKIYHYVETSNGFVSCDEYESLFESWMASKEPVRFIAHNGIGRDINMLALIENLDIVEKAGEEGDKYFSFELIEYKDYSKKVVLVSAPSAEGNTVKKAEVKESENPKKPSEYVVKSGDSLWAISKKMYGDGSKYSKIVSANKSIKNPNLIFPGQKLVIP